MKKIHCRSDHCISSFVNCLPWLWVKPLSRVWLFVTPWTVAHQDPLSMGFSRQEYWSRLPFPSPGDLPDAGIEHMSLMSPALAGGFFTTSTTWKAPLKHIYTCKFSLYVCPPQPDYKYLRSRGHALTSLTFSFPRWKLPLSNGCDVYFLIRSPNESIHLESLYK